MHVWAFGLWCETPAVSGKPGLHTTTRELQTCTGGPGEGRSWGRAVLGKGGPGCLLGGVSGGSPGV